MPRNVELVIVDDQSLDRRLVKDSVLRTAKDKFSGIKEFINAREYMAYLAGNPQISSGELAVLTILDVYMPGLGTSEGPIEYGGIDVMRALEKNPDFAEVLRHIILYSGNPDVLTEKKNSDVKSMIEEKNIGAFKAKGEGPRPLLSQIQRFHERIQQA